MNGAEMIRWAAEVCGWPSQTKYRSEHPEHGTSIWYWGDGSVSGDVGSLAFDLLAKFVEACGESLPQDFARDAEIRDAIPSGPLAVIRAIHETGRCHD